MKLREKDNNNTQKTHNNGGNPNPTQPRPQENKVTYVINQAQPIL